MLFFSRMSLQQKITVSLSAGLLVMLGVFGYLSAEATQQSRDVVLKERERLAETMAIHVDDVLRYSKAELAHIASLDAVRNYYLVPDSALTALRYSWGRVGTFEMFVLIDPAGRVVFTEPSVRGPFPFSDAHRALFNQAVQTGNSVVAQTPALLASGEVVIGLAAPIKNNAGDTVGVLMAEVHPEHTGINLLFVQKLGPNVRGEIIDGKGDTIAVSSFGRVGRSNGGHKLLDDLITRREPGVKIQPADGIDGKAMIVAYAPMDELPWGVVVEQDENVVLALPQTLERMVILMGSLSLLVVLLAAWIAMRGLVRPINLLTTAAERIANGELTVPIVSDRQDELGRLARTLESMRAHLHALFEDAQRWNRELGRQVEERTSQLSALVQASQALASTLDIDTIFQVILTQAKKICAPADAGILFVYDTERDRLVTKAWYGFDAEAVSKMEFMPGEGIAGQVFSSGEPIFCNNFAELLRIRQAMSRDSRARFDRATVGWSRVQKAVGVPLLLEGNAIGAFSLYNYHSPGAFSESDVEVLKALADQASTAIKNSRLFDEASKVGTLRELDRMKSEFVARASHELRTPLASIKSLAETLLRPDLVVNQAEERDYLASIDNACDRLSRIIENLLTVSRIESGAVEIRQDVVRVGEVAARVVENFRMRGAGHTFMLAMPPGLPFATADADRLEDILSNLISNATKYSPPSGTITIGAQLAGERVLAGGPQPSSSASGNLYLELWVADEGIGISEAEQDKLFQRFFRGDNPVTRRASGAGLGLYIVRAYVESMGGTIWVESKPSCGSTFRFTLPAAPVPAAPVPADQAPEESLDSPTGSLPGLSPVRKVRGKAKAKRCVLLVDDELDVLRATARNLRASGYEVIVASSGEDAVDILGRRKLDAAVVDVALPGMTGLDIAHWLRANPSTADLPLVFITAKAQEEDELEGWKAGCDGYIKKPFSQELVLQTVESLLDMTVEQRRSRADEAIRETEARLRVLNRRRT